MVRVQLPEKVEMGMKRVNTYNSENKNNEGEENIV
jgi:hypothetical protein